MMPNRRVSRWRSWLLFCALVVVVTAVTWALWLGALIRAQERQMRAIAAPMVGCRAEQLEVTTLVQSDVDERYEVKGCGRRSLLICGAPDFECYAVPWPR